jgi:anti-sigma-K factor RskA
MTDQHRPAELTHDEALDLAASFVLGALDDDEMAAVRAHLTTCQQPHTDFEELAAVVPVFHAAVQPVEPPPALKDRIMAAAAADLEARRPEAERTAAIAPPPAAPARPSILPPGRRQFGLSWALGIAAVLAIALLGTWNLSLQTQLTNAQAYERQVAAVLDAAARQDALTAVMRSDAGDGPAGLAAVTSDGVVRIAMRDLAPTAGTEVYEAWVIAGDQPPVPLGGFQVGSNGVGYLEADGLPTDTGIVLALTREPKPGATAPSSTPVSVGTATSAG